MLLHLPPRTGQHVPQHSSIQSQGPGLGLRISGLDQRRKEMDSGCPRPRGGQLDTARSKSPLSLHPDPVLHYLAFVPVIDGDFIPDDPVNLFANAADIDYLAGTNNMDGHLFAGVDLPAINKAKQDITE